MPKGKVELVRLDPACIRIWHGNARHQASLNEANCSELIDSIATEGENRVPVIVRPIPGDNLYFELVAGTRRHFAVSHLQRSCPDILLVAQVMLLSDQEAFRIADAENGKRADVSVVERARNYVWALDNLYDGKKAKLANALGHEPPWLSKFLLIAAIPDEVLQAFTSPTDLAAKPAYRLARALDDEERRPDIIARAQELAREQAERKPVNPMTAAVVMKRLLCGATSDQSQPLAAWPSKSGLPALTVEKKDRHGLSILVHENPGATTDELMASFREALERFGWA